LRAAAVIMMAGAPLAYGPRYSPGVLWGTSDFARMISTIISPIVQMLFTRMPPVHMVYSPMSSSGSCTNFDSCSGVKT